MQELAKSIPELVNSLNGGAKGLAEAMQRVAPDAWRIAVRQVVIDAVSFWSAWLTVAAIVLVVASKFASNQRWNELQIAKELEKPEDLQRSRILVGCEGAAEGWQTAKWVAVIVAALVVVVSTCIAVPTLLNPQYEAASKLAARFLEK